MERRRREPGDPRQPVRGDGAAGLAVGLEGVGDLVQPDHRAGLADRQRHQVAGDLGAERGGLELVVDDRHRHHRAQLSHRRGRGAAGHQPGPEGAGHGGQDDVVDRAAVHLAHLAVVLEVGAHGDEPALLGQLRRQRRLRVRAAVGERVDDGADPDAGGAGGAHRGLGQALARGDQRRRVTGVVEHGAERQAGRRRQAARHPVVALELLGVGAGVEQHLADVDGVDAVDEDLVALGEQGDLAVGETLDEVDLPERTVHVERSAHDPADQLAQLLHRAGPRQP